MGNNFIDTVKAIVDEDSRYKPEAYEFVSAALNYTVNKLQRADSSSSRHISGKELLDGIVEYSVMEFGPFARAVFDDWGLVDGLSVGHIVFNMVRCKLMTARQEDSIDDFKGEFDFDKLLEPALENDCKPTLTPPIIA